MWLLYVGTSPTNNCPPAPSSAISHYHTYLKYVYGNSPISPNTKWPPSPGKEFISLAVVKGESCRDEYIGHTLQGNVKQVLYDRKEISIEQILVPDKDQNKLRLVLMEGAPGIGKSMLTWELCRKWEEFSCMKQYSLVVLLRLREEKVQGIAKVSQLFLSYKSKHKKSLVEEVSESQGSGVLFILDGFDELPKTLQKESFLLDLIRGDVLPASTVLVTSRPSATAQLRTRCCPQKIIEILGFTQESVEAYASSILSFKPEKLEKFIDFISASKNPAINSLMYVPLNAAIIVQIYLESKSDSFLPHTLTELYTLLCLTILNRDLGFSVEDLPVRLHKQFLQLSQIAFEGIENEQVIFHTIPSALVRFGILDAVSALYGGGRVSYNFLHLTLQEFLAAYHISHLGNSGLDVLKRHGKDERWNVVWRFVAGLTKFKHYEGHMDFFKTETGVSLYCIQCLFEAQSVDHFSSIFRSSPATTIEVIGHDESIYLFTALDAYALGFCISNFHTGVPWSVNNISNHVTPFTCGLNRKTPSVGVLEQLEISGCRVSISELQAHLLHVTSLTLCNVNVDLIQLSEAIPRMTCLKKLDISYNDLQWQGRDHGFVQTLEQLSHSNVTTLNIIDTSRIGFSAFAGFYSALKQLICPSSGKLEELSISIVYRGLSLQERLASLVCGPSSLKSLELRYDHSSHLHHLINNTGLLKLKLNFTDILIFKTFSEQVPHIVQILECNKTLQHLELDNEMNIEDVRTINSALPGNNTLQKIVLYNALTYKIKKDHPELFLDPRVSFTFS